MNQSARMQKLAGLLTENTDMEEAVPSSTSYTPVPFGDPHGKNPNTKMFTPDGEVGVEKVTGKADLVKKLRDIALQINSMQNLSTTEISGVAKLLDDIMTKLPKGELGTTLGKVDKFLQTQTQNVK